MDSIQPERLRTLALLAAGILVAAIAVLALAGWVVDAPILTAWGAGTIPMAPSTGVLAVVLGAAIGCCSRILPGRTAVHLAAISAAVGAMAALLLFALRLRGVYSPAEHLGLRIGGTVAGAPIGYISPITAFCFLLANAALLTVLLNGSRGSSWRRWSLGAAGGSISLMGFALLLVYALGAPVILGEAFIPPAVNTSLVLLLVGLALLGLAASVRVEPRVSTAIASKSNTVFVLIFIVFAASTLAGGYGYYRQEERELRKEAESQLEVVARLKAAGISQWRTERLGDAAVMLQSARLFTSSEDFLRKPLDAALVNQIHDWLGSYQAYGQYDRAFLIDAQGVTRLSLPPAEPPSSAIVSQAADVVSTGRLALQDFYLDERDHRVHLAILAPILARSGAGRPIGVLVLRIDPASFLYPLIQSWPMASTTAETLLFRRDGSDALFLTDLRLDRNAALRRRIPLHDTRAIVVKAVLGEIGAVEGVDYRGVPVIAALYPIPESPWYLATRIEFAEFNAELWPRMWLVAAFTIALLLGGGSVLTMIGRNQRTRFYQKRAELTSALRESEERLRLALVAAHQGLYDLNVQNGEAVVSPEYATMLGYDPAEFHESDDAWIERMHPDDRESVVAAYRDYLAGRRSEYSVEFRQRTKGGGWKWILSLGKLVSRASDGRPLRMLGTHTDITARKVAEVALRASLLEKEALLKEVHHRVKNNLQVISSLLRLEAGRNAQPVVKATLGEMQSRIQAMALLHETLYRSDSLAQVDLSIYLARLATQLIRSVLPSAGITVHLDLASVFVNLDQAVPCGLVVNELVSNCLKHGFPDGRHGEVRIELQPVDERAVGSLGESGQLRLQVSDTGVGLPADFERRRAESLGLQLVADLARQLGGTLEIGRGPAAIFGVVFASRTTPASSSQED